MFYWRKRLNSNFLFNFCGPLLLFLYVCFCRNIRKVCMSMCMRKWIWKERYRLEKEEDESAVYHHASVRQTGKPCKNRGRHSFLFFESTAHGVDQKTQCILKISLSLCPAMDMWTLLNFSCLQELKRRCDDSWFSWQRSCCLLEACSIRRCICYSNRLYTRLCGWNTKDVFSLLHIFCM